MSDLVLLAIISLCNGGMGCITELKALKPKSVSAAIEARKKADEIQALEQELVKCSSISSVMYDQFGTRPMNEVQADIRNRNQRAAECRLEVQKRIDARRGKP